MKLTNKKLTLFIFTLFSSTILSSQEINIPKLVDAVNGTFDEKSREAGRETKLRNHAKGFCTSGYFIPNKAIYKEFDIPMLNEGKISVVARFSLGGTNPNLSDKTAGRFMALTFEGKNESIGFVTTNVPFTFGSNLENFYTFLVKSKQGDEGREWIMKNHKEGSAFFNHIKNMEVTNSFAYNPYYGVNSFVFDKKNGEKVFGRWLFEPLQEDKNYKAPTSDNFLEDELKNRIKQKPAKWNLYVQLAKEGDDVLNPAKAWSNDNKKVLLGVLSIDGLNDNKDGIQQCGNNIFNPVLLPKGIAPSNDPILQMRTPAYIESLSRRL